MLITCLIIRKHRAENAKCFAFLYRCRTAANAPQTFPEFLKTICSDFAAPIVKFGRAAKTLSTAVTWLQRAVFAAKICDLFKRFLKPFCSAATAARFVRESSSSPPSITPLTSVGLKYSPFNPNPLSDGNMSMLDLLGNSSFDESLSSPDSPEHSPLNSSFDSPPSTVGSLLSQSFAILDEQNSLSHHISPSSMSDTSADQDVDVVEFCQATQCPNCSLLEEKVRKLEKKTREFQ